MDIELRLGHNADVIPPYYNDEPYFSNYLAKIIGYDENGKEKRQYLDVSDRQDCYYNVRDLKQGDIIVSSFYDKSTKYKERKIYYVYFKNDYFLCLTEIFEDKVKYLLKQLEIQRLPNYT